MSTLKLGVADNAATAAHASAFSLPTQAQQRINTALLFVESIPKWRFALGTIHSNDEVLP
jgi:hypothetical protein